MNDIVNELAILNGHLESIRWHLFGISLALWLILFCKNTSGPSVTMIEQHLKNLIEAVRRR